MIKRMKLVRRFSAEPRFEISHVPAIKSATEASWPNIKKIHLAHVSLYAFESIKAVIQPPVKTSLLQ
jgi:hypothetical protein